MKGNYTLTKQNLVISALTLAAIIVTLLLMVNSYKQSCEMQTKKCLGEKVRITNSYLRNIQTTKIKMQNAWQLTDAKLNKLTTDDVLRNGSKLCVYVSKRQCNVCWNRVISYLAEKVDTSKVVVLLSDFQSHDVLGIAQKIPFACYLVDEAPELTTYSQQNEPLVFVMEQNKTLHSVFFIDEMYESMGEDYLRSVMPILKEKHLIRSVVAINPEITIEKLRLRKK